MPDDMDVDAGDGAFDAQLHSRAIPVYGLEALKRMQNSDVLIAGLKGLGAEIAKNVILGGVKSCTLWDDGAAELADLGSQFYLKEADVGTNRAAACRDALAELNANVKVSASAEPLTEAYLKNFHVVVALGFGADALLEVGDICHNNGICFIASDVCGVFAYGFCDFGTDFVVHDTDGEEAKSAMIASVTQEEAGLITCLDEERHGFETGDAVTFAEVGGMTELNGCEPKTVTVKGPFTFTIDDTRGLSPYTRGGTVRQVKLPKKMSFKSYRESLAAPEFLLSDFAKFDRPGQLHIIFQAIRAFQAANNGLPGVRDPAHAAQVLDFANKINAASPDASKVETVDADLVSAVCNVAAGELQPVVCFLGGVMAQEVLKACTGKFTPLMQWLYFDAQEAVPIIDAPAADEFQPLGTRYDRQIAVLGRTLHKRIENLNYFMVGAGALGCELLKNWAMMGLGCGDDGLVHVTDMDTIERSNLNRQFLYRPWDVQKLKSTTAADAVRKMNPKMRINPYDKRVAVDTEDFFDDAFFESLDGVCNALDNIEARLYVDSRCVYYRKSLLESGTLGTKANAQVVVPHLTESYGSSRDPPEKSIPMCTLRNFPHAIEHTLQWARNAFEGSFHQASEDANSYISNSDFLPQLKGQPVGQQLGTLESVKDSLLISRPSTFSDCIVWARLQFAELFTNSIKQLLYNFPADMVTASGAPFWSPPKRVPTPLEFDPQDPLHVDFVMSAANLHAAQYGIDEVHREPEFFVEQLKDVIVPDFEPKSNVKIQVNENDNAPADDAGGADEEAVAAHLAELAEKAAPASLAGFQMQSIEFEKDDPSNFHMDYIHSAGNLRARVYRITECDAHKSKVIAGRIIPAIATTTAMVTGLVCIELVKLLQGRKLEEYKNGYVNLSLPFFGFSEPIAPPATPMGDSKWTLWDRFDLDGNLSMKEFLDYFKEKHKLDVTMVSAGACMLFMNFMPKAKQEERLPMKVADLYETVSKTKLATKQRYLVLEICAADEDDEDVETPYVRLKFR